MENSILNQLGFDPAYLIIGLSIFTLVSLIVTVACFIQYKKLYRRYDIFMRGKDAETLEDTILDLMEEATFLRASDRESKELIQSMRDQVKAGYQKTGLVKYNAFKGMGGNLSFALAILDDNNTGFILNAVHSREGCYLYLKDVLQGGTEVLLGSEEKEALEQALGYH
ncbi:MAG: DUF4446 family protein [Lachnospiraceae bacterium]